MKIAFDNLDGRGAVDYSACLCATQPLKIERDLNAPSRCDGMVAVGDAGLALPVRRARVVVTAESGAVLFTGYVATEPQQVFAGMGTKGQVYRTAFSAVSDEWLLDKQASLTVNAALQQFAGSVVADLTERAGVALVTTAAIEADRQMGYYLPGFVQNWSANAGEAAASGYAVYRVLNGTVSMQSAGAVTHALSDGDGSLQMSALQLAAVKELANDVTVTGAMEPAAYVTERFTGDGTTAAFKLAEVPFRAATAGRSSELITESFDQAVLNPLLWNVTDSGSNLKLGALGLTMTGGNGFDGQTTLTAAHSLEMGGTLVAEAGSVILQGASDGVICGFYGEEVTREGCFAGYNVRQSNGATLVTPLVNGVEVGTSLTALAGHAYTLRIRLHCVETQRVQQIYYAMVDGVVQSFGGGTVMAPMALVFELQDLGLSSNTPATVLYDGMVASSPALCVFAAVNSVQLFGSMGYCRVTQTGSAWVTSTPVNGMTATRLMGVAGEGVDCTLNSAGVLTFLAGRIPVAGEIVTATYRSASRSVARLEDSASIAAEAAGGMPGRAAWLGKVLRPVARSSMDCAYAAQAILSFATSRAAALEGSYEAENLAGTTETDVWPGDLLELTSNGAATEVIVRRVTIKDGMSCPELLGYRIEFANDWAEGLGLTLSEAIATDALLPQTALSAASSTPLGSTLANLQLLQVVSSTGTALQVDAGTAPPAGGGFEVRRRDWDFGPGVDQDLVLRSPVRSFSIPRSAQVERYFVRMFDGSTPPVYSRFSSAVFTNLPLG